MSKICEVCGQLESPPDEEQADHLENSYHLYVCEPCIGDMKWQE
ncbi:hypothetical protein [Ammoniphilus oxalaticus]|nr:hypothetical protein [Ammoniphilus oxalaticus]